MRWTIETNGEEELEKSVLVIRGAYDKFPDFFLWAFKIVVDS